MGIYKDNARLKIEAELEASTIKSLTEFDLLKGFIESTMRSRVEELMSVGIVEQIDMSEDILYLSFNEDKSTVTFLCTHEKYFNVKYEVNVELKYILMRPDEFRDEISDIEAQATIKQLQENVRKFENQSK